MKTKKEKKRLFFISFIIIILIVFLGVSTYKDFVTIVNNKRETKKLDGYVVSNFPVDAFVLAE